MYMTSMDRTNDLASPTFSKYAQVTTMWNFNGLTAGDVVVPFHRLL